MKRKILALMLVASMAFGMLTGCGNSDKAKDGGSSSKGEVTSDANIGVFYYTYSDTYIASVRTALDEKLDKLGVKYQDYDANRLFPYVCIFSMQGNLLERHGRNYG